MEKEINNIRTMEYIGEDFWSRPVYKYIENGILWKDINCGEGTPYLHSCNNDFEGEPNSPIKETLEIKFICVSELPTQEEKLSYQLLGRLKSDCDYYLGYGNLSANNLWAKNEKEQIEKMKELYSSFSEDKKPEWLTFEQILEYENKMISLSKTK